ncbi:hypothetical protein [Neorhizobium sp. DAR64860/K0K1]|jgi:hypothetical protein
MNNARNGKPDYPHSEPETAFDVGDRLRLVRQAHGLSQRALR